MRWITFFIFLYVMTALQASRLGAFPAAGVGGDFWPRIEYLPMLAIFYALYASESAAPLTALFCGLIYDLLNDDLIGVNMIPLALMGWFLLRIRLVIFREHFVSQVMMTLMGVLLFGLFSAIFRKFTGAPLDTLSFWRHWGTFAGNAVYTAIVAPFVFWFFFRFRHLLGFTAQGVRMRGRM